MRILIVTGKGGVGKTSVAAATALRISSTGKRTLVMSTDPAHSLGDSFDRPLGAEPTRITPTLDGQEVDARRELQRNWGHIQDLVRTNLQSKGLDRVLAEEVSIFPGMDELFSLLLLKDYYQRQAYEVIVLDCAPTASTIRQLSLPEVGNWYLRKLFPLHKAVARMGRPLAKAFCDLTLPDEEAFESIKSLIQSLEGLRGILADPELTSIRMVVNLERMVIKEAQRAYTYLNLFGYAVDAVFINRVLPEVVQDGYFERWKRLHRRYLEDVAEAFPAVPNLQVKLFDQEVVGLEALRAMGEEMYGDRDPASVFVSQKPLSVEELKGGKGGYLLRWRLPGLTKEEVDLSARGEELILKAPGFSRNMILPQVLVGRKIERARMRDEELQVTFAADAG